MRNQCFKLLVVVGLLVSKFSFSQTTADFIGDWRIKKAELSPDAGQEERQMFAMLKPIFLKSVFHFKPNNSFSFDCPNKDLSVKDGVWQFDMEKQYFKICERVSKGTSGQLMGMIVKEAEGGYLFYMEETPVILTVTKKK